MNLIELILLITCDRLKINKNDWFGEFMVIRKLKKTGTDRRGYISFLEINKEISFEIKRIYYIYQVPEGTKRGMHAHKKLKQILWCPYGKIEIMLYDGLKEESYILDSPEKMLYVGEGLWRDMYWKKEDSVLCVAASEYYDESDYIRDYDRFIKMVREGYWEPKAKNITYTSNLQMGLAEFVRENKLHSNSIKEVLGL